MIADTDTRDRNAVLATARALAKLDCGIRLCLPEGEGGYGAADVIAECQPYFRTFPIILMARPLSPPPEPLFIFRIFPV